MKYKTYAGKVGQIVGTLNAKTDREALEEAAKSAGVRIVTRIEGSGEIKIFEDWNNLLNLSHPIFSSLNE